MGLMISICLALVVTCPKPGSFDAEYELYRVIQNSDPSLQKPHGAIQRLSSKMRDSMLSKLTSLGGYSVHIQSFAWLFNIESLILDERR